MEIIFPSASTNVNGRAHASVHHDMMAACVRLVCLHLVRFGQQQQHQRQHSIVCRSLLFVRMCALVFARVAQPCSAHASFGTKCSVSTSQPLDVGVL